MTLPDHVLNYRNLYQRDGENMGLLDNLGEKHAENIPCPDCGAHILSRDCEHGLNTERRTIVAIDPGDIHQGVAIGQYGKKGWRCTVALETRPFDLLVTLSNACASGFLEAIIFERFILDGRAQAQIGSEMETSQMIGAIKYIGASGVPVVGQTNKIMKPTRAVLKARGIKSRAKQLKVGVHAADAELHMYHYLIKGLEQSIWGASDG